MNSDSSIKYRTSIEQYRTIDHMFDNIIHLGYPKYASYTL